MDERPRDESREPAAGGSEPPNQPGLLREFVEFLLQERKWWLVPIVLALLLLSAVAWFAASPLAPFVYPGL